MQIRATATSAAKLFELATSETVINSYTVTDVGIVLGDAAGTIDLYISNSNTADFSWKKGVYSLEVTLSDGDVRTLVRGSITAYEEVTR